MNRLWLVIAILAMCVLMGNSVFAEPDLLYCQCLDPGDHTARSIERGICDAEAESAGYQHGVLKPVNCPGQSGDMIIKKCTKKCAMLCGYEEEQGYECMGVAPQN